MFMFPNEITITTSIIIIRRSSCLVLKTGLTHSRFKSTFYGI